MDDWQLLQDYVVRNSETAFRTLVDRRIHLVYSIALRQVRDAQLAEEVAQAVFILLARKARTLHSGTVISGWLFRTTRFVASRALRAEGRRLRREQEAFAMQQQLNTPDATWERIAPAIDEALENLGEADRNAVLLRFFNDLSHRETAATLGISEEAAKKRVTRALEKLRGFFVARGFVLTAAVIGPALAAHAVKGAPAGLANLSSAAALTEGMAMPAIVSETLAAWQWAKIKLTASLATAAFVAALATYWMVSSPRIDQAAHFNQPAGPAALASSPAGPPGETISTAPTDATDAMLFRVVDAGDGSGISSARISVSYVLGAKWSEGGDRTTDTNGMCLVPTLAGLTRIDIGALKDGYVQKFYTWRRDQSEGEPIPSVYVLKLERAAPIGGFVRDQSGRPISGAEIMVHFPEVGDASDREPKSERLGFLRDLAAAKTDVLGRWQCAITPAGYGNFRLEVRHPDFVTAHFTTDADDRSYVDTRRLAMKDLSATAANMVLQPGFQISGVVLNDAGQPVPDAKVSCFVDSGFARTSVSTRPDGTFLLSGLEAGNVRVGASASGFAPVSQLVQVSSVATNVTLHLARGTTVAVRIVDEEGHGLANAWAAAEGPGHHDPNWISDSSADGWVRIDGVPEQVRNRLLFTAKAPDFFYTRNVRVDLSAAEPTIQLQRALQVSGQVVDAKSGQPVAAFKAIPCRGDAYDRNDRKLGTNGTFTLTFSEFAPPLRVRIEADGYEPAMSDSLSTGPSEQSVTISLERKDPSRRIRGTVLLPDGQPAAGAEVALGTFGGSTIVGKGRFVNPGRSFVVARADQEGNFSLDPDANAHSVFAVHESGFGRTRIRQPDQNIIVRLSSFGRVEGRVRTRDGKWSGRQVSLYPPFHEDGTSMDNGSFSMESDSEGRFLFEKVPPGDYAVSLVPSIGKAFTDTTFIEVVSGKTTEAQIAGAGAMVVGRLQLGANATVNWDKQVRTASLRPKGPEESRLRRPVRDATIEERRARLDEIDSGAGREWFRSRPNAALKIAADGAFVAEGLRAGEYELFVDLIESTGTPFNLLDALRQPLIASIRQRVMVSDTQVQSGETLDLGVVQLEAKAPRP